MSRIKKQGLDYFPMDADFTQKPAIRRIMKKEGEGAAIVLIDTLCAIYSREGYYLKANELFYDDLASGYYERGAEDVKRIIAMAVSYEVFDATLFEHYGVLTSVEIQQQFLHSARRRTNIQLCPEYRLVDDVDAPEAQPKRSTRTPKKRAEQPTEIANDVTINTENVTLTPENVTCKPHSIAQHSIANSPLQDPPEGSEEKRNFASPSTQTDQYQRVAVRKNRLAWTAADINNLQPPADGTNRNFSGLLQSLAQFRIPPADQYAIIRKSNYGAIGHPIWKALNDLRNSNGKIKLPVGFLMSRML